uniref:Protein kinase domain-containing protein n=1 Tax=Strigamia maritima TaxID=126957 RepID=T1JJ05_STRMM
MEDQEGINKDKEKEKQVVEVIVCDFCGENHEIDECPKAGKVGDAAALSRARLTLPATLEVRDHPDGTTSVVTNELITNRTIFGPFEANRTLEVNLATRFSLKVFRKDGPALHLDATDERYCNWMALVAPATGEGEMNLMAYQDDIYFSALRHINPGENLLVGYAPSYSGCQYGVLTTHLRTWFLHLNINNILEISREFSANQPNSASMMEGFLLLIELGKEMPNVLSRKEMNITCSPTKTTKTLKGQKTNKNPDGIRRKLGSNLQKQEKGNSKQNRRTGEDKAWRCFLRNLIGEGRTGVVHSAILPNGGSIAVKMRQIERGCKICAEMSMEAEIYSVLEDLQDIVIPKFYFFGKSDLHYVLATKLCGSPINVDKLSYDQKRTILNGLDKIHDRHVIHGDIRTSNILTDGRQFYYIDFGCSTFFSGRRRDDRFKTQ